MRDGFEIPQIIINTVILLTRIMKIAIMVLLAAGVWVIADAAADELRIQTTFFPYYEFTRNVAGDVALTEQFLPVNANPHSWEPSISKIQALEESDVFVYNGLGIEPYIVRALESGDVDIYNIKATSGLQLIQVDIVDIMLDILNENSDSALAVLAIRDELQQYDIANILEQYKDGDYTSFEAAYHIRNLDLLIRDESDQIKEIRAVLNNDTLSDPEITDMIAHILGHEDEHILEHGHEDEHADEHGHEDEHADEHGHEDEHADEHGHEDEHADEHGHEDEHADEHGHEDEHADEHGHHDHAHETGGVDPHVWLDPVLVMQQVLTIRDGLADIDPENAATYRQNAADYITELQDLHADYKDGLANCQKDTIATFHSAFAYMTERYGFNSVSIAGLDPSAGISTQDIIEMTKYIDDYNLDYLLTEEAADPRTAQVIAEETGVTLLVLSPLEAITEQDVQDSVTYIEKMYRNLDVLQTALDCQ